MQALRRATAVALLGTSLSARAAEPVRIALADTDHYDATFALSPDESTDPVIVDTTLDYFAQDSQRDIALASYGRFLVTPAAPVSPFVGAGLELRLATLETREESAARLDLGGGMRFGNSRDVGYLAEVRWRAADEERVTVSVGVVKGL